jgi:carboxyl-terminal processing protease
VIAFNLWMPAIAEPFAAAIDRVRSADGLVIDLRGNPGGLADMMRGIAGHILSEPLVIGRMHMRDADLELRANPRRSTSDGRRVEPFAGPVAILVDGLTGSTSECFAGGLQSLGRVRVFGTTTMGQALPASTKTLRNGDVLMYAIGDFVTSTGVRLEGRGVVPDEVVPLEPAALAAGHDAMAGALAWLDKADTH